MPNGDGESYNPKWCKERHEKIDIEFKAVWDRFKRQDSLLWGILMALVANLGGVVATLITVAL